MSGAEALPTSYVQLYDGTTCGQEHDDCVIGLMRLDYGHPWNPATSSTSAPTRTRGTRTATSQSRLGEFLLYNEYDPRRAILFNAERRRLALPGDLAGRAHLLRHAAARRRSPASTSSTSSSNEGQRRSTAASRRRRAAARASRYADANSDGNDVIFGDLGNDWLVGGTGNDTLWGGWGNDLLERRRRPRRPAASLRRNERHVHASRATRGSTTRPTRTRPTRTASSAAPGSTS